MIVIVYPQFYGVGGIARYLDSFLSNLPADAPEVMLITGEAVATSKTYDKVEMVHIPIGQSRLGLLAWSWEVRSRLKSLRRDGQIDAVNLHIPPLIPGLFLSVGLPVVVTAHTTYFGMSGRFEGNRNFQSPWGGLSVWIKMQMERFILSRATAVISLTEQGRQELVHYGRSDKVAVIPNGVDIRQFASSGQSDRDIDVIFSGRIEKRKGSRPMVQVCRQLIAANPRVRIAIVGYGDDEDYVRSELRDCPDNVMLAGKVPFAAMVSFYQRSKVYVSTSYYEGLPGTCLEAMAMGLPVVVWDLLFYRDLVVDGDSGKLAPANDVARMVAQVMSLLEDPVNADETGRRGQSTVRSHYDWRHLARQVCGVLRAAEPPVDLQRRVVS